MRLETGELEAQEPRGLVRQSVELRRQLQEEQASYRRKLQAYQEGQQRQAQLVQRLQAKVRAAHPHPALTTLHLALTSGLTLLPTPCQILQYKKQCSELEKQLLDRSTELEQQRLRVGDRTGQAWTFPTPARPHSALAPLGHRTQAGPGQRSCAPAGGTAEVRVWDSPWAPSGQVSKCPLNPPFQKCQPGPGERHAERAAGPGKLGQSDSERGHSQGDQ